MSITCKQFHINLWYTQVWSVTHLIPSPHMLVLATNERRVPSLGCNQWVSLVKIAPKVPLLVGIVHWWPALARVGRVSGQIDPCPLPVSNFAKNYDIHKCDMYWSDSPKVWKLISKCLTKTNTIYFEHNIIHIHNNVPWDWRYYMEYPPHCV